MLVAVHHAANHRADQRDGRNHRHHNRPFFALVRLNLVANTLDSATDSLRESTKQIEQKARDEVDDALGGEDLKQGASDALDENRWIAGESSEVASSALRASLNALTAVRQRASASECLWLYTTTTCARTMTVRPLDLT